MDKLCHHEGNRPTVHGKVSVMACSSERREPISSRSGFLLLLALRKEGIRLTVIGVIDQDIDCTKESLCLIKQERDRCKFGEICFESLSIASLCSNLFDNLVGRQRPLEVV